MGPLVVLFNPRSGRNRARAGAGVPASRAPCRACPSSGRPPPRARRRREGAGRRPCAWSASRAATAPRAASWGGPRRVAPRARSAARLRAPPRRDDEHRRELGGCSPPPTAASSSRCATRFEAGRPLDLTPRGTLVVGARGVPVRHRRRPRLPRRLLRPRATHPTPLSREDARARWATRCSAATSSSAWRRLPWQRRARRRDHVAEPPVPRRRRRHRGRHRPRVPPLPRFAERDGAFHLLGIHASKLGFVLRRLPSTARAAWGQARPAKP